MGLCATLDGAQMRKSKDPPIVRQVLKAEPPIKLLSLVLGVIVSTLTVVGLGDSGKSTFNRQLALLNSALDTSSLLNCGLALQENTLQSMQSLLKFAMLKEVVLPLELEPAAKEVLAAGFLTPEAASAIEELWNDSAIRDVYYTKSHKCASLLLPTAAHYYFANAIRFSAEDFKPEPEDIPYVKLRTTGIYTITFTVNGTPITITDVGGQRCERRKWIHCFDNVTAVLYFCAIGEYNMSVEEDETVNRLHESIRVFKEIVCDTPYFKNSTIILFLNKYIYGISEEDGKDFDTAVKFISDQFYRVLPQTMKMRAYVTCAVNRDDCERAFQAIQAKIMRAHLRKMGL